MRSTLTALFLTLAIPAFQAAPAQSTNSTARARARTAGPATAKPTTPTATATPTTPAANTPCSCPPRVQNVQPYTLKQQITHTQPLADGTAITTVEMNIQARDSEGRTYSDQTRTVNGEITHFISIFDYPTQTRYTWNVGLNNQKIVNVFRPRPVQQQAPPIISNTAARRYYPYRTETLPPQIINGIYVEGNRTWRTTPAGYEGNDHDLVTTTESWNSYELGHMIRSVVDDPRSGKTTTETTDIQRSADPALFKPPADYELRENNQQ